MICGFLIRLILFLYFNFNPAKIFMGDTGAMFLGYIIAVISLQGLFKNVTMISFIVPIIGDGEADLSKHLFMFDVCFDMMLVSSVIWLVFALASNILNKLPRGAMSRQRGKL